MLCPDICNIPLPKIITKQKNCDNMESLTKQIERNNFYHSVIVTCLDENPVPRLIDEAVSEDSDYYKISNCRVTEFLDDKFIENFVKNGELYCLSVDRDCMVKNCAAITPDGMLTIHVLDFIYQTLGLEGTKRPHRFYEIKIDLKNLKHVDKIRKSLNKLESFDFYVSWVPHQENICPSSVAKYFNDQHITVTVHKLEIQHILADVPEIPSIKDVDLQEITEWIGLLALKGDISPTESYISTYSQPESEYALKLNKVSLLVAKGFLTSYLLMNLCKRLAEYIPGREIENIWASASAQSFENNLWQWESSTPRMFQAIDCSCNIFVTNNKFNVYSIGQIKFS